MNVQKKILVLFAHPVLHKSRINRKLLNTIHTIPGLTVHNLYEEYPDYHIDIKREQKLLLEHDVIVWHHPFYWYSAPALIKEWIDLVLEHGFAYGKTGRALEGKVIFNALTTGGRREAYAQGGYNKYSIQQFLLPFQQTANLCRMIYLPPFTVQGTHLLTDLELEKYSGDYSSILVSIRDGIFRFEELANLQFLNDILELNEKK